jgi:hypothetical protein
MMYLPAMEKRRMKRLFAFLLTCSAIIIVSACINSAGPDHKFNPDAIWFDYKIWGEEGNDSVTVMLQFHVEGPYGPTVRVDDRGMLTLDGQKLQLDTSSLNGPIYSVTKHIRSFTGNHSIVFTDADKKKFREDFSYKPFSLITTLKDTISRKRLAFDFSGLDNEDYLRILMTDTSFTSEGINRLDTVSNNRAIITKEDLSALENGPIQLEFIREREKTMERDGWETGTILMTYSLKREFFLKD